MNLIKKFDSEAEDGAIAFMEMRRDIGGFEKYGEVISIPQLN